MDGLDGKYVALKDWLSAHAPLALAFSGGVDSSFLLAACREADADHLAITVDSVFQSETEREDAFALAHGDRWLRISVDVLGIEGVCENPPERCYLCKREIFKSIFERAEGRCVIDGTNYDDLGDFRPGMRALRELGVKSPLMELGWRKADIREMSRRLGLSTADKPAMACLATRIPMGERIEPGKLRAVDMAENAIKKLGFAQVRVRAHGDIARIELDRDMLVRAAEQAADIVAAVKGAGFKRAALDLDGYNMGSMNERSVSGR
ncbi:MAG: ATP-dependent sacrificial sulfur transferase LarE [Candidatus Fimadaptatus sp.]|jgi:uncharacterized protein